MAFLDPSQGTEHVPAGRRGWKEQQNCAEVSEEGPGWLHPSAVNRKGGNGSGARLIPGQAHNAGPERGIINTRGQGRAAGTMGSGRMEKAGEDESRAKATPPGGDAALGPAG